MSAWVGLGHHQQMGHHGESGTKTILIAEDNPTDRGLMRYAWSVAEPGIDMFFVRDGLEAVEYLKGEGKFAERTKYPFPDVMVLDLRMPRMDGLQVVDWLAGNKPIEGMKVMVLADSSDPDKAAQVKARGVKLVQKPDNVSLLIEFVHGLARA